MLAPRGSTEGRGGGEFRLSYWECPAERISETEALFSLELASCFTWRKQFPFNREEYCEHTLIFPNSAENPTMAVGVRRGRSVQVHFVMGRRRRINPFQERLQRTKPGLASGGHRPDSPDATPRGSGPLCGNLPPAFTREAVRADRGSWHSPPAGRAALPAACARTRFWEKAGSPQRLGPPGRWRWAQERPGPLALPVAAWDTGGARRRRHVRKHHLLSGTRKGRRGAVAGHLTAPDCRVPRSEGNSPSVPGPGLEPRPLSLAPQVA